MPVNIQFVKYANGEMGKMIVNDEGEEYELNKINDTISTNLSNEKTPEPEIKSSREILSGYVGKYTLTDNPKKTIIIELQKDNLIAKILGQETEKIVFLTDTKFKFKNVTDAKCEFIKENGKVTKFIVDQNGKFEWKKIK